MFKNNATYNTLIEGQEKSGKSMIIKTITEQLKKETDAALVLVNCPTEDGIQCYGIDSSITGLDITESISRIYDLADNRLSELAKLKMNNKPDNMKHLFMVIDDLDELLRNKRIAKTLEKLIVIGRSAHVHLIASAKDSTRKSIPGILKDGLVNEVCLKQATNRKYHYCLGCNPGNPPLGYAFVRTPKMYEPGNIETVKFEEVLSTICRDA